MSPASNMNKATWEKKGQNRTIILQVQKSTRGPERLACTATFRDGFERTSERANEPFPVLAWVRLREGSEPPGDARRRFVQIPLRFICKMLTRNKLNLVF